MMLVPRPSFVWSSQLRQCIDIVRIIEKAPSVIIKKHVQGVFEEILRHQNCFCFTTENVIFLLHCRIAGSTNESTLWYIMIHYGVLIQSQVRKMLDSTTITGTLCNDS